MITFPTEWQRKQEQAAARRKMRNIIIGLTLCVMAVSLVQSW